VVATNPLHVPWWEPSTVAPLSGCLWTPICRQCEDARLSPARSGLKGRNALIGIIVAAYAIFDFDDPVMLAVLAAAVFLNPWSCWSAPWF
jgi:hypothetical protein